jgi:hypothetical protein
MSNKQIAILALLAFSLLFYKFYDWRNSGKAKTVSPPAEISSELQVIGRLESIEKTPDCGTVHFGAIAKYTDLIIIKGKYAKKEIFVVHGCPEMPRKKYSPAAGNLKRFLIGDYHQMFLSKINTYRIEVIEGDKGIAEDQKYYCVAVNAGEKLDHLPNLPSGFGDKPLAPLPSETKEGQK